MDSDTAWRLFLAAANAIVATLNWVAYGHSQESRDMFGAIAWMGSTAFWVSTLH